MTYTTFIDDLLYRIDEYNDSFKSDRENRFPKRQQETWAPDGRKKAITQKTFGYDDEHCLRLLAEFGYDGKPVSSQTASTVRKWFETTNGHIFPPQVDVLRMGLFFNLDFFTTLHWVLRAAFEQFLVENDPAWSYLCGKPFLEIITSYGQENRQEELKAALERFHHQLDTDTLFWLFEKHWRLASSAGYDRKNFSTLIDHIFLENLLNYPNQSQKIQNFSAYQQRIIIQLQNGTAEDQETLWRSRCIWQLLLEELDSVYIEIENTRLKNAETDQAYLRLFGPAIIEQTQLETEIKLLEMRLSFMRLEPGISEEKLAEKIRATQEELEREVAELCLLEAVARENEVMEAWQSAGVPMAADALDEEKEQCRREIRAIRKMVHPDILQNNPEYQNLSEEQKAELHEILLDSLKIRPSELGYPPNFAYHDMRSLEGLRQVRRRVESILKMNNIRVDVQYEIQGETIHDQIHWLKAEIVMLENQINAAKGQLTAMMTDTEVQSKKALIRNTERQKVFAERMEERNSALASQRDQLLAEIAAL